jgi:hypothetical protein
MERAYAEDRRCHKQDSSHAEEIGGFATSRQASLPTERH